uniref:Uncharacterized protein n=1 Tax=Siphoviridae sp. ctgmM3 TaxID=2827912 RepID=A0A8S5TKA2_9CAUD|nr:MAG TPA: hypothetical protein [Siphoviridae sp. ctgmM3]
MTFKRSQSVVNLGGAEYSYFYSYKFFNKIVYIKSTSK